MSNDKYQKLGMNSFYNYSKKRNIRRQGDSDTKILPNKLNSNKSASFRWFLLQKFCIIRCSITIYKIGLLFSTEFLLVIL